MEVQESLSDQSRFATRAGVSAEEIAKQVRERFLATQGDEEIMPWEELPPDESSRWIEATERICEPIAQAIQDESKVGAERLAKVFVAYFLSANRYDSLEPREQLGYQVCVRHIVNMVAAEDANDVRDAVAFDWKKWFQERI